MPIEQLSNTDGEYPRCLLCRLTLTAQEQGNICALCDADLARADQMAIELRRHTVLEMMMDTRYRAHVHHQQPGDGRANLE